MMLPYTPEVFFSAMARYNAAWFPLGALAWLLMLGALALALRPPGGDAQRAGRLAAALLAAAWVWTGWAHQQQLMAGLNFMAPIYALGWIGQGVLIALAGGLLGRLTLQVRSDALDRAGLAIAALGLAGVPLAVLALGHGWRAVPLAGSAPDPTALVTVGLLAMARGRAVLALLLVPLAWAGVAGLSGYLLGSGLDLAVAAVLLAGIGVAAVRPLREALGRPDSH